MAWSSPTHTSPFLYVLAYHISSVRHRSCQLAKGMVGFCLFVVVLRQTSCEGKPCSDWPARKRRGGEFFVDDAFAVHSVGQQHALRADPHDTMRKTCVRAWRSAARACTCLCCAASQGGRSLDAHRHAPSLGAYITLRSRCAAGHSLSISHSVPRCGGVSSSTLSHCFRNCASY